MGDSKKREKLIDALISQTPISVWSVDKAGVFTEVSGQAMEEGQFEKSHFIGHSVFDLFKDQPTLCEHFRRALAGEAFRVQVAFEGREYDSYYAATRNAEGEVDGAIGIATDVTEHIQTLEKLRRERELSKRVIETVPGGIVMVSPEGALLEANRTARGILGLSQDELTGRLIQDFEPDTIREDGSPCPVDEYPVARCLATRSAQPAKTIGVRRPNGDLTWAVFTAVPATDPETGDFLGAVVAFLDVTERKEADAQRERLEQQLAEAQKIEAIGRLAGGLAHDLNNVLSAILGHASLLREKFASGSPEHEDVATIELAGERAARLTQQLLGFARRGKHQDLEVDLDELITEVIGLLRSTIHPNIHIRHEMSPTPCLVRGDPGQLQQVLINLALNARDAMPDGGDLVFQTGPVTWDAEAREPRAPQGEGDHVMLSVTDTGTGISNELKAQIFEPFFTTKEQGKGTGMGLAMVHGIVANHGGFLRLESQLGAGSAFELYLPAATRSTGDLPKEIPTGDISDIGRVLLVDDEVLVRSMAVRLLRRLGCSVTEASDGEQALRLFRAHSGVFNLVLLDLVMPRMDGAECFDALREIDPDVKVLVSSGYGQDGAVQELLDRGAVGFLQKPYSVASLADALRRAAL